MKTARIFLVLTMARRSRARAVTAIGLTTLAVACSGGAGIPAPIRTNPNELPGGPNGHEPAGSVSGLPTGGGTLSASSSSSGGTGSESGNGTCPACNTTYNCIADGQTTVIALETVNSQCIVISSDTTDDAGASTATFSCNGTITEDGTTLNWTSDGSGGFSFSVDGTTVTCDPS